MDLACSPPFLSLVSRCEKLYISSNLYLKKDTLIIFVCGASKTSKLSRREQFISYANKHFDQGSFFRAEDTFSVIGKSPSDDWLTIEHNLAEYSDCILIINESTGTNAELGAFASNDKVAQKLLVVNPHIHKGETSFINLGPLAKISRVSHFKETMNADFQAISVHFDAMLDRIRNHAVRKKIMPVHAFKENGWKCGDSKLRLLLLKDLINLFCPISNKELLILMKSLFPNEYVDYKLELGLLIATNEVFEENSLYVTHATSCTKHSYYVNPTKWLDLRRRIISFYRDRDRGRLDQLKKRNPRAL